MDAEHLPLDGFWFSARGVGLEAYLLVRHDDCEAIERYPLSMPTSAIRQAYREAHPAPDPELAIVLKSEAHELAFWNAFHEKGGYPRTPESECYEEETWVAYLELQAAGLLRRDPDSDVTRHGRWERAKYRPTASAEALLPKLEAYRKDFPNV